MERLVEQAVADPKVLAIKQTVYRTSDDSPLVPALIRAAERGKQAVCLVELKARFDERANISWARALEEAGVHVVYGLPALKTHAKSILIVRREGDGVRHYVHVGTGNYHPKTAGLYTDFGLLTCDEQIGADVADMFNQLTGFARPGAFRRVLMARRTCATGSSRRSSARSRHEEGRAARIAMKMNSLVESRCIQALYRASQAGVPVELNVRGICCLRPGVPGVSDNIRVHSIVGRFLEHSRIYAFERNGEHRIYIGSADLMPRNLDTRVELLAPVRDESLRAELRDTLERCMADNTQAWTLDADGVWAPPPPRRRPAPQHAERASRPPRPPGPPGRRGPPAAGAPAVAGGVPLRASCPASDARWPASPWRGVVVCAVLLAVAIHSVGGHHRDLIAIFGPIIGAACIGTGLFAWLRRPENRFGPLMVAVGFTYCLSGLIVTTDSWPFIAGLLLIAVPYAVLFRILLAFPSGRLATRGPGAGGRDVPGATVGWWSLVLIEDTTRIGVPANPLLIADDPDLFSTLARIRLGVVATLIALLFVVLVRRWHAATPASAVRSRPST